MEERRLQEMCSSSKEGGEEMSQDPGPRILAKYVEGLVVSYASTGGAFTISNLTGASGWSQPSTGDFHWEGFIDLSGYRGYGSEFVLVPQVVECQYGGGFLSYHSATVPGGNIYLQYAITTDKLDDLAFGASGNVNEPLAGFISDNSVMDQVVYAGTEIWGPASAGMAMVNAQKMTYGDAPPIVGPRLYISIRMTLQPSIVSGSYVDTSWAIPPMRFVLGGVATEVPEYQLLHLMKRQIDLQQTPDVD